MSVKERKHRFNNLRQILTFFESNPLLSASFLSTPLDASSSSDSLALARLACKAAAESRCSITHFHKIVAFSVDRS